MRYDVVDVHPLGGHLLAVSFEDGRSGTFDMAPYLSMPCFAPLRSAALFGREFVDEGTVARPGDIDIAPEALWEGCIPSGERPSPLG